MSSLQTKRLLKWALNLLWETAKHNRKFGTQKCKQKQRQKEKCIQKQTPTAKKFGTSLETVPR
jgi:hypothetical protein